MTAALAVAERPAVAVVEPGLPLRDYQVEALQAIDAAERRGRQRLVVALPTGTGKTVLFAHLIRDRMDRGRALVLVHRDELVQQAMDKLQTVDPLLEVGIVKAERDEHWAQCVLASVQTISRPQRLLRMARDFGTLVVDEAHHATADSYKVVLTRLGAFAADGPLTVGFTATPERGDGVGLDGVFEEICYQRSIEEMIAAGYLVDLRARQIRLQADFAALHTRAGDFVDREVEQALLDADAPEHAVEAYLEHADGRKALVFTPTVAVAHAMAEAFRSHGVSAEALDAGTPLADRRAMLRRLKDGDTRVIANCAVLTEGFDEPSVDCIIVARPTRSRTLYIQMVGRGTRTFPGKDDCLILDLVGSTGRHDLQTATTLFGLEEADLRDATVSEALEHRRIVEVRDAERGRLIAAEVDLFARRPLRWLKSDDSWVLGLDAGYLALVPDGEQWAVVQVPRWPDRPVVFQRDLELTYAQGVAEDELRRRGARWVADPNASWRGAPISENQRALLQRRRIAIARGMTRGQASDAILLRNARLDRTNGRLTLPLAAASSSRE